MFQLRFLGIRARLILLLVTLGFLGAFSLVSLIPSAKLSLATPRIFTVVCLAAFLGAWFGRGIVRPLRFLEATFAERLLGKESFPPQEWALDEISDLRQILLRYLDHLDQRLNDSGGAVIEPSEASERELRTLLRLAQSMPGPDGERAALERLLAGVVDHLVLSHASILLLDPESGRLELHVGHGLDAEVLAALVREGPKPVKFAQGVGVSGVALASGRTKVAPRGRKDKDFARLGSEFENKIRSLACVPLRVHGEVVGVLNAVNTSRVGGFDLVAVEFLEEAARLIEGYLPGLGGREIPEGMDPLTRSMDAATWQRRFEVEVERHKRWPRGLAVAVLELAFPEGEPLGPDRNASLAEVGRLISQEIRGLDLVGRDGNRFLFCLPETDLLGAIYLAGRVKDRIDAAAIEDGGRPPRFVGQLGLSASPELVSDPEDLLAEAEAALQISTRAGDHRLACQTPKVA